MNSQFAIRNSNWSRLIRPLVRQLHPYVPGEQPKIAGWIKLNTNENPYGPSPRVLKAIRAAVDNRLRLYPDPTAQALRKALAKYHHCQTTNIIVGNGSDELLALATRAFVEPLEEANLKALRSSGKKGCSRSTVQYFTPSYSLYPVLAAIHRAVANPVALEADFGLPSLAELKRSAGWNFRAALTYITTPNAPTGRGYATEELAALCRAQKGVVILDEAYVEFARDNAIRLALTYPHVLVARTFSKAYSLCFQRVGYLAGHPELIAALDKIRDSYNVNGLGQIGARATLQDLEYYRANFQRIIRNRENLSRQLAQLGFQVFPSQTNFILVRPPQWTAEKWLLKLRQRKIIVRWFNTPQLKDYLRITIGSDKEMRLLTEVVQQLLRAIPSRKRAKSVSKHISLCTIIPQKSAKKG